MKVPVFVSAPTDLNPIQEKSRKLIINQLNGLQLEPRALGRGDYPAELPLREVYNIARHCAGGIILGFIQFETRAGKWKRGTPKEKAQSGVAAFPTPWNHLEAGILFGLRLPLLIFREPNVTGGVFDQGVTDVFIHPMPVPPLEPTKGEAFQQVFLKWASKVREIYYSY